MANALDRLRTLRVADVMTRNVVTVSSHQTILDVARKFVEHDVTAAPVTDSEGRCIGFFSAADFLRRELHVRQANATSPAGDESQEAATGVSRFMSGQLSAFSPSDSLFAAARFMCEQHLHRLPVVSADGRVVGIISTMDVVAALVNAIDEMEAAHFSSPDY